MHGLRMDALIKIGISSCLLGNKVRYDGDHSYDQFLTQTLTAYVDYVPVCPEVECGMPVPREPICLMGDPQNPRLVTRETGVDKTAQMNGWIMERLDELEKENLCGFIFKNKSPSSGLYKVPVYGEDGTVKETGTGIFAKAFIRRFPQIPVQEAICLRDFKLRKELIARIFAFGKQHPPGLD